MRVATTTSFALAIAISIGAVSLVPAYLLAHAELNEVTRYQELQGETREAAKRDTALQTTRLVNAQIDELLHADNISARRAIEVVMRDWDAHAENIIISSFVYDNEVDSKKLPQLRVSGEARNRNSLNSFVQTLRVDPVLTDVSFPISDLAGGTFISFSLTVSFKD